MKGPRWWLALLIVLPGGLLVLAAVLLFLRRREQPSVTAGHAWADACDFLRRRRSA